MIHVCFGLHDADGNYSKFTGTAMLSIFSNTTAAVTAHILHDNTLTQDNRDKFVYVAGLYGQRLNFYNVEKICAEKLSEMIRLIPAVKTARVSVGAFFRLLIPQILPTNIDKLIYLDSDMLVNLNIVELWRTNLDDKPLAAVREMEANAYNYKTADATEKYLLNEGIVKYEDYFNSGVLVMNLEYLRKSEALIMSGIKWRGEHTQCNCFDQDILNYLFAKDYVRLPVKFDCFICNERSQGRNKISNAIYHCNIISLGLDMNDPFNQLWMEYFIQTPWFGTATIDKLYAGFQKIYAETKIEKKNSLINLSAIMSGKTRAFFFHRNNLDTIKRIFAVRGDEEIIFAENNESLKILIDAMIQGRSKKIFFVLLPNFPFAILKNAGFVYGRDFLNGFDFLPNEKEEKFDSCKLIKTM